MITAIALCAHPANKDASTIAVQDVHIGCSTGTVFKAENGFIPAFRDMAPPGYMPDAETAVEWIDLAASTLNHKTLGLVQGATL